MMQEALADLEQQKNQLQVNHALHQRAPHAAPAHTASCTLIPRSLRRVCYTVLCCAACQAERWSVERSLDQRMCELSALVGEFNALGVAIEILPSSARHANGQSLQLSMTCDVQALLSDDAQLTTPAHIVQPDLKLLVKPLLTSLSAALSGRVASLTSSSRVLHDEWVHLTELRAERQRALQALEQALSKREEQLKQARMEMNESLRAMVEEVEAVEGKVNEERSRRCREEREAAEKALADAEADKGRREAEWRAERQREQSELWMLIEDLVNHAERIHTQLHHIHQQTQHIRHTSTHALTPHNLTVPALLGI